MFEDAQIKLLMKVATDIVRLELLPPDYFEQSDCDSLLDARDSDKEFESQWVALYEEVNGKWATRNWSEEVIKLIDTIRFEALIQVSEATQQHEIASYVSDDFDLIVRGTLLEIKNKFLDKLINGANVRSRADPAILPMKIRSSPEPGQKSIYME